MEIIKWGIIGCGDVTEIKSGPAFNLVPSSKLVAVMRRNGDKAKDYARRHGVPKWYADADELINDTEVNAIYIATPPLYHETYAVKALQAGKPVYVEKPMAVSAAAAQHIADVAKATGVKLCVAHYRRQWPLFLKIKSLLQQHIIGQVKRIELRLLQPYQSSLVVTTEDNWRIDPTVSGGGLFHDLSPHQLDILYYLFGKPAYAAGIAFNQGGYYKAADTVSGQMVFDGAILFNGIWSFAATETESVDVCTILGEKGSMQFSFFDQQPLVVTVNKKTEQIPFEKLAHVQQPMIEKVVNYFLGKEGNPSPGDEGVEIMKLIAAFTKPC